MSLTNNNSAETEVNTYTVVVEVWTLWNFYISQIGPKTSPDFHTSTKSRNYLIKGNDKEIEEKDSLIQF